MKPSNPELITKQLELTKTLDRLQNDIVETNRKMRNARKELDKFIQNNGDVIAKQKGFERQEAWKEWNTFVQTNPFVWFEEWFKERERQ